MVIVSKWEQMEAADQEEPHTELEYMAMKEDAIIITRTRAKKADASVVQDSTWNI